MQQERRAQPEPVGFFQALLEVVLGAVTVYLTIVVLFQL